MEILSSILSNSIMITAFVLVMMLLIEFTNVYSNGRFENYLQQKKHLQIVFAALIGIIPGCLGTYTAITLFTHNIISKGAIVATLIATSGDEAFFMLSLIPKETILITAIIFIVAIASGYITNALVKIKFYTNTDHQLAIHSKSEHSRLFEYKQLLHNFKHISFQRAALTTALLLFLFGLLTGVFTHSHTGFLEQSCEHSHNHDHGTNFGWIELTMFVTASISLICISLVNEHFLEEHLWEHIIKKHALKTFLWTVLALGLIEVFNYKFADFNITEYQGFAILILAVLIGIIPESGPHLIFISLYLSGQIPLSILIANSIVQDGHGALPLFAESKKSFITLKAINAIAGLTIGGLLYLSGN